MHKRTKGLEPQEERPQGQILSSRAERRADAWGEKRNVGGEPAVSQKLRTGEHGRTF